LEGRVGSFEPASDHQIIPYPGNPDFPTPLQEDPFASDGGIDQAMAGWSRDGDNRASARRFAVVLSDSVEGRF
jgi:hypothetical protein